MFLVVLCCNSHCPSWACDWSTQSLLVFIFYVFWTATVYLKDILGDHTSVSQIVPYLQPSHLSVNIFIQTSLLASKMLASIGIFLLI